MISWEGLGEGVTTGRAYFELLGLVRETLELQAHKPRSKPWENAETVRECVRAVCPGRPLVVAQNRHRKPEFLQLLRPMTQKMLRGRRNNSHWRAACRNVRHLTLLGDVILEEGLGLR